MRGTVVDEGDNPDVSSIVSGTACEVAMVGIPFFHTQANRYKKLFCIIITSLVENNKWSQC